MWSFDLKFKQFMEFKSANSQIGLMPRCLHEESVFLKTWILANQQHPVCYDNPFNTKLYITTIFINTIFLINFKHVHEYWAWQTPEYVL